MSEIPERTLSWEEEEAALAQEEAAALAIQQELNAKQEALAKRKAEVEAKKQAEKAALAKLEAEAEAKKQAELAEAEAKKQAEQDAVRDQALALITQADELMATIGKRFEFLICDIDASPVVICKKFFDDLKKRYASLEQPMEVSIRPIEVVEQPVEVLDHQETFASIAAASVDEPVAPQAPKLPTNIGFTEVKPKSKSKSKSSDLTLEQIEEKRTQNSRFRTIACKHLFNGIGSCTRAKECAFAHSIEQMPKFDAEPEPEAEAEPELAPEEDLTVAEIMERRKIKSNFRSSWCDNYYGKNGCDRGRSCWFAHEILVNLDGSVYADE